MSSLWRDVRFALRMLAKNPGFTIFVVVVLGLSMGVNSGVFNALNVFLMRQMPVANPQRLAAVFMGPRDEPRAWGQVSYLDYLAMREQKEIFTGLVAATFDGGSISDTDAPRAGSGERASAIGWELLTGNAFDELGVRAALGRTFSPGDDQPSADPVVVISDGLWRSRFKGDPSVIGRKIYLTNFAVTVVGVMPRAWRGTQGNLLVGLDGLWLPMAMRARMYRGTDETFTTDRARRALSVLGHLQPGVTFAQAEARLEALAQVLAKEYPATNADTKVTVVSEIEGRYGKQYGAFKLGFVLALFAAALVLLVSCANVANLLLSRAARRTKELGIRVALGAGRGRIIRQLLTESMLLALLGGGLGLLVVHWFSDLLHFFLPPMPDARLDLDFHADARTLAWTFGAAVVSGLFFGAAPAWRASRTNVVTALKTDAGAEGQRRRAGLRQLLVIAQLAISIVVLAAGGLLLRSLEKIKAIDPGFRTENLISALVNPSLFTDDVPRQHQFFDELQRRLRGYPGVVSVSSARYMPLINFHASVSPVVPEGQAPPPPNRAPSIEYSVVYSGYFQTAGTEILFGRDFYQAEHRGAPTSAIINRELARRLFGQPGNALGRRVRFGPPQSPLLQIVGIARDGRYTDLLEDPRPWIFFPESAPWLLDTNEGMRTMLVRGADSSQLASIADGLRNEVDALDARLPVEQMRIGSGHLIFALYGPRLAAELGTILGLLALGLATMGIYSVMTYAVSQRTKEIGIRMALGGQVRDVIQLVLRQGMGLIAVGVGVGSLAGLVVARLLRSFLFGVSAADPWTFAATVALLLVVALLATLVPARRAAKVDPMVALRQQ